MTLDGIHSDYEKRGMMQVLDELATASVKKTGKQPLSYNLLRVRTGMTVSISTRIGILRCIVEN